AGSTGVIIITGAGSGIGKRTALAFWNAGYDVVLAGRREDPLLTTVQEAGVPAERALVVPADVSDPQAVRNLFARTVERFGRLGGRCNNAGIGAPGVLLEDLTLEQWRRVVDINLTGTFLCTQEAFRIMKDQTPRGGRIINDG